MTRKRRYDNQDDTSNVFVKPITPKNETQKFYMDTISEMTITLCSGPAGTAKTYISAWMALHELLVTKKVSKIILTRPIVACEDIGFLPGDMKEKIHPYLMPLFDSLEAHIGVSKLSELLALGVIEILPLAFMRGRSLNNSFIILDEAQNTTEDQMKMFITRIGFNSKMVINGDANQSDIESKLNRGEVTGLQYALDRLSGADREIGVVRFGSHEIVRNPLISRIIGRLEIASSKSAKSYEMTTSRHSFHDETVVETTESFKPKKQKAALL